ncbi:hypothetical protein SUDANB176_05061 [Streptomyces sp. enrichment culture]
MRSVPDCDVTSRPNYNRYHGTREDMLRRCGKQCELVICHGSTVVVGHGRFHRFRSAHAEGTSVLWFIGDGTLNEPAPKRPGWQVHSPSALGVRQFNDARTADYPWTRSVSSAHYRAVTCRVAQVQSGLRSRVRRFESCRGHSPMISRNHALTRADAARRGRESVSLTPALSRCLSRFACEERVSHTRTVGPLRRARGGAATHIRRHPRPWGCQNGRHGTTASPCIRLARSPSSTSDGTAPRLSGPQPLDQPGQGRYGTPDWGALSAGAHCGARCC